MGHSPDSRNLGKKIVFNFHEWLFISTYFTLKAVKQSTLFSGIEHGTIASVADLKDNSEEYFLILPLFSDANAS